MSVNILPHRAVSLILIMVSCLLVFAAARASTALESIIAETTAPAGVVIEIVMADESGLSWALPKAQAYIKQLKQRFPEMPIAIVSHGREQFALSKQEKLSEQPVHELAQSLVGDGVELHVCGTYAGWNGFNEEDFPNYINVSAAGPAQINDYKALEYRHLIITDDD